MLPQHKAVQSTPRSKYPDVFFPKAEMSNNSPERHKQVGVAGLCKCGACSLLVERKIIVNVVGCSPPALVQSPLLHICPWSSHHREVLLASSSFQQEGNESGWGLNKLELVSQESIRVLIQSQAIWFHDHNAGSS